MGTLKFDHSPTTFGNPGALYPPALPAPVQARKGGRQIEKTHNTEGLGSENISMFFSNSIVNRKGFLPRPALFRGWTGGSRTAGSAQEDAIRNIAGKLGETIHTELFDGAFYIGSTTGTRSYPEGGYTAGFPFLDASRVVPTANENRPANVALPVALYIGLPA